MARRPCPRAGRYGRSAGSCPGAPVGAAAAPRVRAVRGILPVAVGLAISGEVEPVARPALAVYGRFREGVDETLAAIRASVSEVGVDLLGRRRQAGQVQIRLPQKLFGRVGSPRALSFRSREGVDRITHRAPVAHCRPLRRAKCPMVSVLGGELGLGAGTLGALGPRRRSKPVRWPARPRWGNAP